MEILAKSTKKLNDPAFRAKAFFKNVFNGQDHDMQDLLQRMEDLAKSKNLLVGAETLTEVKLTNKNINILQRSMNNMQVSLSEVTQEGHFSTQEMLSHVRRYHLILQRSRMRSRSQGLRLRRTENSAMRRLFNSFSTQ